MSMLVEAVGCCHKYTYVVSQVKLIWVSYFVLRCVTDESNSFFSSQMPSLYVYKDLARSYITITLKEELLHSNSTHTI